MRFLLTIFAMGVFTQAFTQVFKEKVVKTEIREVTVFLNRAQVFETGDLVLPKGKTSLVIKNLSPYIDDKSIQVKAEGDFTILSVAHKFNYLNELKKDEKIDSLSRLVDAITLSISRLNARLSALKERENLLNENRKLGGQTSGATILQLKQAMDFFESEVSKIREEEIQTNNTIAVQMLQRAKYEQQKNELDMVSPSASSEIEVRVSSENQLTTKLRISYLVANAGWFPKYDIRVANVKSPLQLTYKAEVFQNTGVDWKNVKLKFSNGDPNQSGAVPELQAWNLTYARNTIFENSFYGARSPSVVGQVSGIVFSSEDGSPLPGVNVVVKGSTIGTVTSADGSYALTLPTNASSLVFSFVGFATHEVAVTGSRVDVKMQADVMSLSETVVTGYGLSKKLEGSIAGVQIRGAASVKPVPTSFVENQTTVEFEVNLPYSIYSDGEKLQVDLKEFNIDASYQYFAIPKLDKDAFLVARVTKWDQYNLLEGEANLYFENAFVGRSILEANALRDTLNISLGKDKSIVISREKNEQFSKTRMIGSNVEETRNIKILVRNKKSQPITLTLLDQIPVSVVSDISVTALELTKGILDAKSGSIAWELKIDQQQQKEINLQYEVRYPKRERVVLE